MTLPNRIIVVEDNLDTQQILKEIFIELNILEIDYFRIGEEVLQNFKSQKYELILMDIELKGQMDGIQLSKRLIQKSNIPIIFMSAYSDTEIFSELLEVAPYGFLEKPFTIAGLQRTLSLAYRRYLSEKNRFPIENTSIDINSIYTYSKIDKHLYKNGEKVKLNIKEYKLLEILVQHIDKVVTFDNLVHHIWGIEPLSNSSLRTLVYSLKRKLPKLPIVSYSKLGYSLFQKN